MPDFSEFKDPWEDYSPRNDPTDNNAPSGNDEKFYYGIKYEREADAVRQNDDHSASQLAHNRQFHYEQQHSSYTPVQTYNQHQNHATSHPGENRDQEHFVQHTEHHHWQQHSEQKHHVEQHQHNEQRHYHAQHQHHEQQHYERRQHNEHHQQFHQHDCHINKADEHHYHHQSVQEPQSAEVRHENHAQHYANNHASHQNAEHLSHIVTHNESHAQQRTTNQDTRDNFASHYYQCKEKTSEQAPEAANKQTDTQRIDFPPFPPAPCTDLHNVATRSDPNVMEHLDNANVSNCSHILFFSKFELNILSLYVFVHISENISASVFL